MRTDALDFELPDALIATQPAEPRDSARLMVLWRDDKRIGHHHVRDLPALGILMPGDVIVVNQTRVLRAYLAGRRTITGGKVTGLYIGSDHLGRWQVLLESRGALKIGESITLTRNDDGGDDATLQLIEPVGGGQWLAKLQRDEAALAVLERVGSTPLPPYIRKQRRRLGQSEFNSTDQSRYNTVFAGQAGSVAAPTAGLHFTPDLLDQLAAMGIQRVGVDLHVGMGTFAPVRSETLQDHRMHEEWYTVPRATLDAIAQARSRGGRLLIIGTTTVRALESMPDNALEPAAHPQGITATTSLFIHPEAGFEFRFTDRLMTNFHLPRSTLLAMVAALPGMGLDRLMDVYQQAIAAQYRFYSYGDAMLIV